MRPDLATTEGRRAYRAELGRVARGWRWTGLALVTPGAAGLYVTALRDLPWRSAPGIATIAALGVGWGLVIVGIFVRTRYHGRRMRGMPRPQERHGV